MLARTVVRLLVVAGTLVPATAASAQELPTTTLPGDLATETPGGSATETVPVTTTTLPDPGDTASTTLAPEDGSSELLGGGLSISVPGAAALSAGTPLSAGSLSAPLGAVTVTDDRAGLVVGWTVSVSATPFTSDGATIPSANVAYWSGPATATTGAATFLPGQPTAAQATPLGGPAVAFAAVTASGGTSATWTPTVVVTFPPAATVGEYHGTITHSVA
jgi:hypothetical protein